VRAVLLEHRRRDADVDAVATTVATSAPRDLELVVRLEEMLRLWVRVRVTSGARVRARARARARVRVGVWVRVRVRGARLVVRVQARADGVRVA
jgi:hypothetical protein